MTADIAVGVVGTGRIARVHAAAYRSVRGASLVSCMDLDEAAAQAFARDFGLKTVESFEAMIGGPGIDALIIATPNSLHARQTIAALAAGKHVFCQKPIALDLADARMVAEAAASSDRVLQFGFMLRFTPPLPALRSRVAAGELGQLIASQSAVFGWEPNNEWFYDPRHGGGVILDTLVHFVDLVLWVFGDVDRVHAEGGAFELAGAKKYGSPDNATVTLHHRSGAVSSMYVSWTSGYGNFRFDVFGTEGSAGIDLVQKQTMTAFHKAGAALSAGREGWEYPDLVWDYGYAGEQQYFVDHILGRVTGGVGATAEDAVKALEVAMAAQRSLDEARVVTLP
ncbi:MAG TPA: Gfo/Idh/MocA family oxidoreductase [Acidimicrobiales bacterium]|nr:Gfo/Idh/MocA family oxidoreductase [Acidimicrobiales bacterium]